MSADLASKVRKSMIALQGRQAVIFAINMVVGIILARKLGPTIFGIYGIATFCLSLIALVTDAGLAGSLVQRKETFGQHEVSVAFTLQTFVSLASAGLTWLAAPLALKFYHQAPPELVWVIRSLALPMLLSPIGTTARLQLEREIQFHKIATLDIITILVTTTTLLTLVFNGFGIWSFVWGDVAGSLAGAIGAWSMIRFKPRFKLDGKLTRELFSFGMIFQFVNITNTAAGWIIPLISGSFLGPVAVGLLTWASSNGRRPLMVVDNVMRVAFPHFSRLQDHPAELAHQVNLYFRRLMTLCSAWAFLAILLGAQMTHLVYTDKWMPGVLAFQCFAIGLGFDVANWVGGMTLTAVGGVKDTAKWTLVKSIIAITLALIGVRTIGIVGIPLASIVASLVAGTGILIHLRRRVPVDFRQLWMPVLPFLLLGVAYFPLWMAGGWARMIASWVIGSVAVAWTVYRAKKEFAPGGEH